MKFDVIVCDAPWRFSDKLTMSEVKRGADAQYATMSFEEILALPVADVAADDCLLALWVPNSMLVEGIRCAMKWGFTQKQVYTWVKTTSGGGLAFGLGRQFRACTELALICTRGRPKPSSKSERNAEVDVELALNMGHSKKPDGLQERLERMYPSARKLELFARRAREGWHCTGLECPGTEEVDVRDWLLAAASMGKD